MPIVHTPFQSILRTSFYLIGLDITVCFRNSPSGESVQVLMTSGSLFRRAVLRQKVVALYVLNETVICLPSDKAYYALFEEFMPQNYLTGDAFWYVQILNTLG